MSAGLFSKEKWPRWSRALLLVLTLAVCGTIFGFSAQSGVESNETSQPVVELVLRIIAPGYEALPAQTQSGVLLAAGYFVRKLAHFTEYAVLGFLLRLLLESLGQARHASSLALGLGALYAASDELHQLLGGTRTAMWQDVALDSAGVLAGVTLGFAVLTLICRHAQRRRER